MTNGNDTISMTKLMEAMSAPNALGDPSFDQAIADQNNPSHAPMSADHIIPRERARLQQILDTGGIPEVYDDMEDYLVDVYPDFSWNANSIIELETVMQDPEWQQLAQQVNAMIGFDFAEEFQLALDHAREEYGVNESTDSNGELLTEDNILTRPNLERIFADFLDRLEHDHGNDRERMYQYHLAKLEGLTPAEALHKMPRGPRGRWSDLMADIRADLKALSKSTK